MGLGIVVNCLLIGKTALHWAAAVNNVDGIRLLLHSNANKDIQDHKVRV